MLWGVIRKCGANWWGKRRDYYWCLVRGVSDKLLKKQYAEVLGNACHDNSCYCDNFTTAIGIELCRREFWVKRKRFSGPANKIDEIIKRINIKGWDDSIRDKC